MPQDSQDRQSPISFLPRLASVWPILALETLVVAALVVGVWWFVGSQEEGWPLVRMLINPGPWLLVIIVSAVGATGNLALYYLGRSGTDAVFERFPQLEGERWKRVGAYYQRHGARLLIFSAIPGLGTVLTTGAGAFHIRRNAFLAWVFLAKLLRNWLVIFLFSTGFRSLFSA
jgi:membrane protein YqaA with SNARE-associated domain